MPTVAIIGGGAAGMVAAYRAAACGSKTVLLEKNERLGKKLVITGKGRCNVTNDSDVENIVKNIPGNGPFLYSALTSFTSKDLQEFLTAHGASLKVERGRRVFPRSDSSFAIVDALVAAIKKEGVEVGLRSHVNKILVEKGQVEGLLINNKVWACRAVIVCTGGLSYPATGSTGDGYRLAEAIGHTIVTPKAALVPLRVWEDWPKTLRGLSLKNVKLTLRQKGRILAAEFGEMLFTHFGISGPIVLSLSREVTHNQHAAPITASINLKPNVEEQELDRRLRRVFTDHARKSLGNALPAFLPKRLIPTVTAQAGLKTEKVTHQVTRAERMALLEAVTDLNFTIKEACPPEQAIVTAGGVDVREIDPKTMQSKLVSGLYFAGEVIDVDGYTGGFNLQAAFSTGYLAGQSAALSPGI